MDGFSDVVSLLFWLLMLYVFVNPQLAMRALTNARMRVIRRIEERYGWRVVTLIHRQETVSFFGIPVYRYIDVDDSEAVIRAIRSTPPDMPIALILHTPGGLVLAAAQIAMALKRHPARKIVIVPHYAMSGGTLIALAADEIYMDPDAVLGPLDPQIQTQMGVLPAPSIVRVARERGDKASDEMLVYADIAEKALREVQGIIVSLLDGKMPREKALEVAKKLTEGGYTHDYPITVEEARSMGLPVRTDVPPEVYALMELYPQTHQQRPGVEYIQRPLYPARAGTERPQR
ncbi:SDH family Clp fold serine proteinase [Infirmifilum sp. NZ]|uniref:SDH family Clp fold serine proteinase n=1 Tax=Infirmifilum sp. NZ TaxID=2926850 RepID=UPI0026C0B112|nr:ATP-dependent Clp protease proteolytic subunit [Infirmifilum sp. NZ]UNQ73186.1 ATP-dependent Clp protease proteolytic subunit [Infirmifilum sp. NZ]